MGRLARILFGQSYYRPSTIPLIKNNNNNHHLPLRASISLSTATALTMATTTYTSTVSKPITSPDIPPDALSTPHHVKDKTGTQTLRFKNPHPSSGDPAWTPFEMLRKILWSSLSGNLKMPDPTKQPAIKIPTLTPQFLPTRSSSSQSLRATWLGHACYLLEFPSGLKVLFDPVFESRCAPVQFAGPKRYSPPPCNLSDLPPIDAVIISHSHYDHLSHSTVQQLAKSNPEAQFFVGLGLEKWFKSSGIQKVTEMDWWQDVTLTLTKQSEESGKEEITAQITCLPSQHSSGRTGFDPDQTLWASWAVSSRNKNVWFGGDTGYRKVPLPTPSNPQPDYYSKEYESLPKCPQFKQIGERRGPFDLGLIPIGAYSPRWLFSWMHADPFDAVEIFKDTKCKKAVGIHWGTWVLTTEEVEEPPRLLKEALRKSGIAETGVFDVCAIGETREY
ncbi:beta-lactamase superfamily domain-containing protein [Podospora fimiseda]|uniref:Beta-lactamase superfamily domain-containing protein n=1 Tax=Podospora fimiseda TaxID=252190 RepID=A0AAN7H1J2_9PEZI|nr:beta-lactamase superfamily domain-containing protein [Podospora fimiseda]